MLLLLLLLSCFDCSLSLCLSVSLFKVHSKERKFTKDVWFLLFFLLLLLLLLLQITISIVLAFCASASVRLFVL